MFHPRLLILLSVLAFPTPGLAQEAPDREAILAAVNRFLAGARARDTVMMASVGMPGATVGSASYADGKVTIGGGMAAAVHAAVATMQDVADEKLLAAEVWQDGDIATIWGPYELGLGSKLLHCGYNGYNMARVDGRWQYASVIFTERPTECPSIRAAARGTPREPGSSDRSAVLQAVEGFFAAMRNKDSAGLANSFTSRATWTVASYRESKVVVSRRVASLDVDRMAKSPQALDERWLGEPIVRIDGDIALVWGYYQFKVDGKVTHCGYDSFHMLRQAGAWRIEGGAYTVRPAGCR
jgi:hypothetical protein